MRIGETVLQYMLKRIFWIIPVTLSVLIALFSLMYLLPGDPASIMLGPRATSEVIEALNHRLGLDQPVHVRLGRYIWGVLHGDLGESVWGRRSVLSLILDNLPYTVILTFFSMGLAAFIGIILGTLAALHRNTAFDRLVTILSLVAASIPDFVAACLLLLVFAVLLDLFPVTGSGKAGNAVDQMYHLILPGLALGLTWLGYIARLVRAVTLEVLDSDYIKMAKSFGAPARYIAYKYALKNSIIPTIALLGLGTGKLLGGTVFVEIIFFRPGIGKLISDAVFSRDLPIVQGGVLVIALLYILVNLIAHLSYGFIDPRVQYS